MFQFRDKKIPEISIPKWGGSVNVDGELVKFSNTCVIDTWLFFLKVLLHEEENFIDGTTNKQLLCLKQFIIDDHFDDAKLHIAILNNINLDKNIMNFFGNEKILFLDKILKKSLTYLQLSTCDNTNCSAPIIESLHHNSPSLEFDCNGLKEVSPAEFTSTVSDWLFGSTQGKCGRQLALNG